MADSALDVAVEAVRDRAGLVRISAQWEELARHALETDALHDPAMTLALLDAAGKGAFRCCLSWARDPERSDLPSALGALFALRRERGALGLPSWIVQTALVSAVGAQRHLGALLDWLERSGATVVEFRQVPREGRLNEALAEAVRGHDSAVYVRETGAAAGPLRDLVIGLGAMGEMWIPLLALLDRARRRRASAARPQSRAVAA